MLKHNFALLCIIQIFAVLLIIGGTTKAYAFERSISVYVYDGTRTLMAEERLFVRLRNGLGKEVFSGYIRGPVIRFTRLPFHDNSSDNYTVNVSAIKYRSAGVAGVKVMKVGDTKAAIMLLARESAYDFSNAQWRILKLQKPEFIRILSAGAANENDAELRFYTLLRQTPDSAACLLNILAALESFRADELAAPLSYLQELTWDATMAPDRFYGYVRKEFVDAVVEAQKRKVFGKVAFPSIEHKGATRSFRELSFTQGNLQITFHEGTSKLIDGQHCIRVEFDIDYYRDLLSHLFQEVIPNTVTNRSTDPQKVYRLRWTASINHGRVFVPSFSLVTRLTSGFARARNSIQRDQFIVERKNKPASILPPWKWKIRRLE